MANRASRQAAVFGFALVSLGMRVEAAEAGDKVTVRVRLENAADVPRRILDGAQYDASRIYKHAGIDVVWLHRDDPACCAGVIRVVLPSLTNAHQYLRLERVDKSALGEANAAACLIHIFWDRLARSASRQGRDEGGLLGVVLAHEIGHVLLPGAGHSPTGIMQASVELRMLAPLRFTDQQSESMRGRLRQDRELAVAGTQAITIR